MVEKISQASSEKSSDNAAWGPVIAKHNSFLGTVIVK